MATYFRDFSDVDGISDWTELAHVSGQHSPAWAIQNTDEVIATSASSHLETLAWNDIESDADRDDVEVVGQAKAFGTTGTLSCRTFAVRISSTSTRTCYLVRLRASDLNISRANGVTVTSIASDSSLSLTVGNWYWVRFRVVTNGGTSDLKAKVWADGDSEPGTWNIDSTDSTYSTAGSVGLCKGNNTIAHEWRHFGVGTNGDTAPTSGAPAGPPTLTGISASGISASGATLTITAS